MYACCLYGFKSIRRTYTRVSRQPSCHLEVVTALPTTKIDDSLIDAVEGFGYLFTSAGKFMHEICHKICKQAMRKQKLRVRNAGLSELKFQLLGS